VEFIVWQIHGLIKLIAAMKALFKILFVLFLTPSIAQSDYYWVGGSGNWSDFANHWATTSGGTTFHSEAPTFEDDVYFDANSFIEINQKVTLAANADCKSMSWSGVLNNPSFEANSGIDLNIYGSLSFEENATYDLREIVFHSSSTGETIDAAGVYLGQYCDFTFEGSGEWSFVADAQTRIIKLNNGVVNFGSNTIIATSELKLSGATGSTIANLQSATLEIGEWETRFASDYTLNSGTSTIRLQGCCFSQKFYGDGQTYYNIELPNGTNQITGSNTFNNVTIDPGVEVEFEAGETQTFNELEAVGTASELITVSSDDPGTQANLVLAGGGVPVEVYHLNIQDLAASGAASFAAFESIDNGNNTGWNITAPAENDYFWVGGSGSWSDLNHWATTSGGSTFYGELPTQYDNVIFDQNSFSADDQMLTMDVMGSCHDMDWTAITFDVSIEEGAGHEIEIYGSVALSNLVRIGNDIDLTLLSGETETFSMGDDPEVRKDIDANRTQISFEGDGTWTIQDHITTEGYVYVQGNATLNLNGNSLFASQFSANNSATLNTGDNSTITIEDWIVPSANALNFGTGSSIILEQFSQFNSFGEFRGGDFSYSSVTINNQGQTIRLDGSNTFESLNINAGASVEFENGETQTINELVAVGTKFDPIVFYSDSEGTHATISKSSGTVDLEYIQLKDMHATGGATFNANNSIDNGNNTGWNITAPTGQDYYWIGNGGSWNDLSHWVTTSGGSTQHSDLPGSIDNVFFDLNSFDMADQIVDASESVTINDLSFSGVTNSPMLDVSTFNVGGSITLGAGVTIDGTISLISESSETITSNGSNGISGLAFEAGGTFTLQDDLHIDNLSLDNGATFVIDDQALEVVSFLASNDCSFSAVNATINSTSFQSSGNVSFSMAGSTLTIEELVRLNGSVASFTSFGAAFNSTGAITYGDVILDGIVDIIYNREVIIDNLTIQPGSEAVFKDLGSFTPVSINNLIANGTENNRIIIKSSTSGTPHIIESLSGTAVTGTWLEITDSQVSGATFTANDSFDNGNNSGWTINEPLNIPDAPENLFASDYTFSGFTVNWDEVAGADSYRLDVARDAGFGVAVLTDEEVSQNSFDVTGLFDGDDYYWRVRAVNSDGTSSNSTTIETYTLPKTPVALDAESVLSDSFTAKWEEVDRTDNYRLDVSENADFSNFLTGFENLLVEGTAQLVDGLSEGQTYYYRVRAENVSGQTPNSNVITVSTGDKQNQTITFDLGANANKTLGDADFTLVASATSGLEVSFSSSDETVATVSGNVVSIVGSGTTTLTASQEGNSNFNAAPPIEQLLTIGKASQTITFDPDPIPDQNLSDGSLALDISVNTGLPLTVSILSGDATIGESGTQGTYDLTYNSSGTVTIEVAQAGDDDYASITETISFNVIDDSKSDQTITFDLGADQNKTFGDTPFTVSATSSSGLPVTFAVDDESIATVEGSEITIVGAGTTSITASQSGDDDYNPATSVSQTLTVNKAEQTISFSEIESKTFGDADFELEVTASSGLPISYSIENTFIAEIDENTVTIKSAGTTNIIASQAGDDNYNAALDVTQAIQVDKAAQVITFDPAQIGDKSPDAEDFSLTISNSSGLVPDVTTNDIISLESGTNENEFIISILTTGEAIITVSQGGNSNYLAVEESLSFNVPGLSQEITFEEIDEKTFGDDDFEVSVSASSGLSVELESSNLDVATISGETISIVGAGTTVITASQEGNDEFDTAEEVSQVLIVNKANQTITFNELEEKTFGDADFVLDVISSSGLPITFTISDENVAEINDGIITLKNAGSTSIIASQAGNDNYNAATSVSRTLTVAKANQEVTFDPATIADLTVDSDDFILKVSNSSGLALEVTGSDNLTLSEGPGENEYLVSIESSGDANITASHSGTSNYLPVEASLIFGINKLQQEIIFEEIPLKTYGDEVFELDVSSTSGLDLSIASSNEEVAIVEGLTVTIIGAGTTIITASQEGDDTYSAATEVSQELIVSKADQTITFETIEDLSVGGTINLSATATSGLDVSFEVEGSASLDGNSLTILDEGTLTITASQSGDENWNAAESVSQIMEITETTLGISNELISIYPNPFMNVLHLDYSEPVDVRIYSLNGSIVQIKHGVKDQLDVSALEEGMYLLEIESNKKITRLRIKKAN
jgi:hypothetical protein